MEHKQTNANPSTDMLSRAINYIKVVDLLKTLDPWVRCAFGNVSFSGGNLHKNENSHPEPLPRTIDILRQRLANDIQFYHFARQRLRIQNQTILNSP